MRLVRKILERSVKTADEYSDQLCTASINLDLEEPEETSAKWNAWKKRVDELQQIRERMDRIAGIWVEGIRALTGTGRRSDSS